ncbi:MAG: hypothetical protein ABL908_10640 [Hyphomicrobium sp.]
MTYALRGFWIAAVGAAVLAAGTMTAAAAGNKIHKAGVHGGNNVVVKKRSNKGVGIAVGIAAATAAAILLTQPSRAEGRRHRDHVDDRASKWQCRKWDDRCDDGENWACRKLRNQC